MRNARLLFLPVVLLALIAGDARASSAGYHLHAVTAASAGGISRSAGYLIYGTLGQPAVSASFSDSFTVTGGIWRGYARGGAIYLPYVARNWPPVHDLVDAPDACASSQAVEISHLYRDDFDRANDNDWYRFQAIIGWTYTVETSGLGSRADTVLALFAADCTTRLAENDDVAPGNRASRIVWTAPTSGVYCVDVRGYDWRVYGANTGYILSVSGGAR